MASRINSVLNKIHPVFWQACCIVASILIFSLVLINRSPNILRPLSMSLRTGFGVVIPATIIVMVLLYRLPGRIGEMISMTATLSLFAMPLAGVWALGGSRSVLFNGLFPLADASNFYIDGLRILAGMDISHFSAMRPIFPVFLSLLLDVTGRNLMFSLGIISAIAGLSYSLPSVSPRALTAQNQPPSCWSCSSSIFVIMPVQPCLNHWGYPWESWVWGWYGAAWEKATHGLLCLDYLPPPSP